MNKVPPLRPRAVLDIESREENRMRPGRPEALEQPYDPTRVESQWYSVWEEQGVFQPRPEPGGKPPFVITIPPPNVTGRDEGHCSGSIAI